MNPIPIHKTSEKRLKYLRDYRKKNRIKETRRKREWFERNPEKRVKAYKRNRNYIRNRYNSDQEFYSYLRKRSTRIRRGLRGEILSFLGGKCKRCGFSDPRALCVDHVNGGGSKERKLLGLTSKYKFLERVKRYPKKYQILCANCNSIKRHENGEWSTGRSSQ